MRRRRARSVRSRFCGRSCLIARPARVDSGGTSRLASLHN
jgi:hypothetical protein